MSHTSRFRTARRGLRHGVAAIYVLVTGPALFGLVSLGVDFARVQTAKTELQRAADASARYGAAGLGNIIFGVSAAASNAVASGGDNLVDGVSLSIDPANDVTLGVWDSAGRKFTATVDPAAANAVKVVAHRSAARGNAVPLLFGPLIGRRNCDLTATAIAVVTPGTSKAYTVPATSNPFLAGMPAGSVASLHNPHNSPDYAGTAASPRQSPVAVQGIQINPGASLSFDGINGGANNDIHNSGLYSASGNMGWICNNTSGDDSNIANMNAPINSLVAVFLDDTQPDHTSAPASLDFSTAASQDFSTLKPQLKQIFFVGAGRRANGEVQQFVVPPGATRLYLGTWDTYEWNNNIGSFNATIHQSGKITLVQ